MLMFSLAGIPPLAGFFAKWYVFLAAVQAKLYVLAVLGVVTSAVAAYYYLRIVKIMYFDEAAAPFDRPAPAVQAVLALSTILMLIFWIYPSPVVEAATSAAQSLF
jgi:NADH-quinone oxidoreductase subunit N